MFDKSRIGGLVSSSSRSRSCSRYAEDEDLSDDISDDTSWDHKRSNRSDSAKPRDLSEILKKSRGVKSDSVMRSKSIGLKSRSSAAAVISKPDGIKSRLGLMSSSEKTRLMGIRSSNPSLLKRSSSVTNNLLKQNIIKAVQENVKKGSGGGAVIKPETFIEKKNPTGEAIDWDSRLSRPRMGMVADMADTRVSAKTRIKESNTKKKEEKSKCY